MKKIFVIVFIFIISGCVIDPKMIEQMKAHGGQQPAITPAKIVPTDELARQKEESDFFLKCVGVPTSSEKARKILWENCTQKGKELFK